LDKKHILVTGSHRSGSTWIGKVLSASSRISYVHEPFNIEVYPQSPVRCWFEHLPPEEHSEHQSEVRGFIQQLLKNDLLGLPSEILKKGTINDAKGLIKQRIGRLRADRRVIKDPIALMSAEWMARNFTPFVIVTVRHPAAFAASLKVKDWTFDFQHFAGQQELLDKYLEPYQEQIRTYAVHPPEIIAQACLLWNCIHHVILQYRERHPDWLFVRHEDLSLSPVAEYGRLFNYLQLPFDTEVQNYLQQSVQVVKSTGQNISARENITNWKKRLTSEEIELIRKSTKEVADKFYADEEW
jgi:hypothetical protein